MLQAQPSENRPNELDEVPLPVIHHAPPQSTFELHAMGSRESAGSKAENEDAPNHATNVPLVSSYSFVNPELVCSNLKFIITVMLYRDLIFGSM